MTEQLEQRIRRAVQTVDRVDVGQTYKVFDRASRRLRRRERNRKMAVGGATVCILALVVVGVAAISVRDVAPPNDTAGTAVASVTATTSPLVDSTVAVPSTSAPAEKPRWRPIAAHPDGIGWDGAAVWMGEEAFVLGERAYAYDPATDAWRALAAFPESWTPTDDCSDTPEACFGDGIGENEIGYGLVDPIVVWTGDKVLVMGGDQPAATATESASTCEGVGCYPNLAISTNVAYVPAIDRWQMLAVPPWFVNARSPHAWTGRELLVWPWDVDGSPDPAYAFDPTANTWRRLPDVPISPRQNAATVWTGTEWIVWGGGNDDREFDDGAAFNPATDTWRVLGAAPISARKVQGVWTGAEMLVMAGSQGGGTTVCCGNFALSDGAAYDPATDTWRPQAGTVGHPGFEPLWTGEVLLMFAKGGVVVYDPLSGRYLDVCCDGMAGSVHITTGTEVISFGSYTTDRGGGIFTPP
jgi:hypothetical protein